MAEHFRDFADPAVDAFRQPVLTPEPDATHRFLVKHGASIMEAFGAMRVSGNADSQRWLFAAGSNPAVIDIHEPDIVIPALLRYRDVGLFYTYTADKEPLWTSYAGGTSVPPDADSGNPVPDSLVVVGEALYKGTQVSRRLGHAAARLVAPVRDARARQQWRMSTDRTKEEIWAHYDLSQDVYTGPNGFLDEAYVQYSSGLLPPGHDFHGLEELQARKIESLAHKLELDTAETLLEVGGGWGGLAVALAQRYPDLHVTSLTVSEEQLKRARRRAAAANVADRVNFVGMDYRKFKSEQPFDRVVSVEMIEAVDWRDMDTYFGALVEFVNAKSGVIVLQSINIKPEDFAQQRHNNSFANTAIFPGGILTPKAFIEESMADRNWQLHEATSLGSSYAITLREWIRNLYANKPELTKNWQTDDVPLEKIERFYRGFSLYLALSQAGFRDETSHLQNWQLAFKPRASNR